MKILNITVPDDLSRDLESIPNKNSFITEALKEKLEKEKMKKLDDILIEGYKETKNEDKKMNKEWEAITLEGWN
ncbi:MAG: hypothetical protein FJ266_14650 [Planctomycetes bacterium]|nr:hypothetical protein [Planctomycetota bacterium]